MKRYSKQKKNLKRVSTRFFIGVKSIVIGLMLIAGVVYAGTWLQTDSTNRFYKVSWNEFDAAGPGTVWNAYSDSVDNMFNKLWRDAAINVKSDYGAVGDGVTDDTTAITNALAAGDNIYFPAGNYNYNGQFIISSAKTICGDGSETHLDDGSAGLYPYAHIIDPALC